MGINGEGCVREKASGIMPNQICGLVLKTKRKNQISAVATPTRSITVAQMGFYRKKLLEHSDVPFDY